MTPRQYKDTVYAELALLGKALASPARVELLDLLAQAPRTVESLATELNQSVANTSQHLRVLRGARLVDVQRAGTFKIYRLASIEVIALTVALRRAGRARALEIDAATRGFLGPEAEEEQVDLATVMERVARHEVTLIDVRSAEEYAAGHIPGAVSRPLAQLSERLHQLPADLPVVAYCRGPWCVLAIDAVSALRSAGFRATRLDAGVAEWRAAGGTFGTV